MNKTEELLKLMRENPTLPVVPMVNYEVVAEDNGYWLGAWGYSYVGEYFIGRERIYFKDDDDIENSLIDKYGFDKFNEMTEEEVENAYKYLPWVKAIIVNINLPD